jgi:hypothetical protein
VDDRQNADARTDGQEIVGRADVDRNILVKTPEHGLEVSSCRLRQKQRPYAIAAILDRATYNQATFGYE